MYLQYFNLKYEPFSITPDPRFLFLSHQHEAALESLSYGIHQRKGFLLLTGEIGTGKTTLCRELINRLDLDTEVSVIFNPLISVSGLIQAINKDFGIEGVDGTLEKQLEALNQFLISRIEHNGNAVVLIDEAQNLSIEALEMTRLLSNLETDRQKLLQILLVGQPELELTLQSVRLRQLNQRISIRQHLDILTFAETKKYIARRLFISGGDRMLEFNGKSLKKIHQYTGGSPRVINILCDRILLAAYARRTGVINAKIVQEAIMDLNGRRQKPWWRFWPCRSY